MIRAHYLGESDENFPWSKLKAEKATQRYAKMLKGHTRCLIAKLY